MKPLFKYEEYSEWSRKIAKYYSKDEIEKELGIADSNRSKLRRSHRKAVESTTSMESNSQRRAQARNSMVGNYERYNAYLNALELYKYYPEKCKDDD